MGRNPQVIFEQIRVNKFLSYTINAIKDQKVNLY